MATMGAQDERDDKAVRRFVEHFAMIFSDLGFPRMPARVLGALMAADEPGLPAGEIGERLGVSAAAISGAVRYLMQIGFVVREPVPGSRRDVYRMPDGTWYTASIHGRPYQKVAGVVREGVLAVGGEGSPAGDRLADARDFFLFIQDEMDGLLERWEHRRATAQPPSWSRGPLDIDR